MKEDKDYKKIINILHNDFGWGGLEYLDNIKKELVNDIVKATKQLINPQQ